MLAPIRQGAWDLSAQLARPRNGVRTAPETTRRPALRLTARGVFERYGTDLSQGRMGLPDRSEFVFTNVAQFEPPRFRKKGERVNVAAGMDIETVSAFWGKVEFEWTIIIRKLFPCGHFLTEVELALNIQMAVALPSPFDMLPGS